ncbi:hypothetical protein D3093_08670 [Azospirillum argentinense]|uniref:Uncharacterized protein n=1 Tax=Azospirillum argentinense TaxID=2970906 RepID=A0A4D8P921_9PROT|nr:hypothetical protein [Azospirillum argentinense]QCN95322.1 hypothetical protein D3093_08670 [Azospirillum argentinense]
MLVGEYREGNVGGFYHLQETLYRDEDGNWTLNAWGWMKPGLFGHFYGRQIPGCNGDTEEYGRNYSIGEDHAAFWLVQRGESDQYTGKTFDEVFPGEDPPTCCPDTHYIEEIVEVEVIQERIAAWDGKDVADIFNDIATIIDAGVEVEALANIQAVGGVWPDNLSDFYEYYAVDEQQCVIMCEGSNPIPTLQMVTWDHMITETVIAAKSDTWMRKWLTALRKVEPELTKDEREKFEPLLNLAAGADASEIRIAALKCIPAEGYFTFEWM